MAIHYVLRDNKLTTDPTDHTAIVVPTGAADQDDLINRMVQGGSTLGRADIAACLEQLASTLGAMLLDGLRVSLPIGSFSVSIDGKFTGAGDAFDATRHRLNVNVAQGPRLRDVLRTQGTTQKDVAALPTPVLTQFKNVTTGALNSTVKAGGLSEIKGDDLKFNATLADEGIFFVPGTGAAVKATVVSQNEPRTLTFQAPTVTAQLYTVEVRHRFSPTGPVRVGQLPVQVTGVP